MKRLLLSLIMGMSLNAASSLVELTSRPSSPDRLFHDGSSFVVQRMGVTQQVPAYAVEREIRSYDVATLLKLQEHGYFDVQRSVEGNEYRIEFQPVLKAGGVGGANAGFWAGRFLGYGLVYGLTAIVCLPALAAGPVAYGAAFKIASVTVAPIAEATATTFSVAGGVAGGVATGPV
jgi:hypothetical protein